MARFIGEAERQFGNCNEDYAQYAVEMFEFCIQSASRLRDHLESRQVLSLYKSEVESLLSCLRELCQRWLDYCDLRRQIHSWPA